MNFIGFWKEYHPFNEKHASLFDLAFNQTILEKSEKKKIIEYLENGVFILGTRSIHKCKLDNKILLPSHTIFSDGTWLWSNYFTFYFHKYDILFPPNFLELIRRNNYSVPIKNDVDIAMEIFEYLYSSDYYYPQK